MKKILIIGLLLCMFATAGCSPAEEPEITPPETQTPQEEPAEETPEMTEEPVGVSEMMMAFNALLTPNHTADDLGTYIASHIDEATQEEADEMVTQLVLYQTAMIEAMNMKIYTEQYMVALNEEMGGILDPQRVGDIENPVVRQAYQDLIAAKLTVVRYEETPAVETDWAALSMYSDRLSADFGEMCTLYDRIQNFRYNRRDPDFAAIAQDAIAVEALLGRQERSFLSWQLNLLYRKQVANLLIGPEGSYAGTFLEKHGALYDALIDVATQSPASELGQFITELDTDPTLPTADFMDLVDRINGYKRFGFNTDLAVEPGLIRLGDKEFEGALIRVSGDEDLTQRLNDLLTEAASGVVDASTAQADYDFHMSATSGNDRYMTWYISVYFTDDQGNFQYTGRSLTLDLNALAVVTMESFLGAPYEDLSADIAHITSVTFSAEPEFSLHATGVTLIGPEAENPYPRYANLTVKDLLPYCAAEEFYQY